MTPLELAIQKCGSQSELARRIGGKVRTGHIYYWLRNGVPGEHCRAIEQITEGEVKATDLRPDVFGEAPKRRPSKKEAA